MSKDLRVVLLACLTMALVACGPQRRSGGGGGGGGGGTPGAGGGAGQAGRPDAGGGGGGGGDQTNGAADDDGQLAGPNDPGADADAPAAGDDRDVDPGIDLGGNDEPDEGEPADDDPTPVDDEPGPDVQPDPDACEYPAAGQQVRGGQVIPRYVWDAAVTENGDEVTLDLQDLHCDSEFTTLLIFVGALWCTACPQYLADVASQARALADMGMGMIFLEVENNSGQLASTTEAARHLTRDIGNTVGWRVGDRDTRPQPLVYSAPTINGWPAAFIVRVRDMRVIADQAATQWVLPLQQIAANPDGDWSEFGGGGEGGGNPGPGPGVANCDEGDEERFEPNDQPPQASEIGAGSFEGGICGPNVDFYTVNIRGEWRLDLEFDNETGDLDVYAAVERGESIAPVTGPDGEAVGSDSTTDNESFEHQGRTLVVVQGYEGATAPYTMTITEL